jgi:hypothetical protein
MDQEKVPLIATPEPFVSAESLEAHQERRNSRSQRRKRFSNRMFTFLALFFGIRLLLHGVHRFEEYRSGHPHHPWTLGVQVRVDGSVA